MRLAANATIPAIWFCHRREAGQPSHCERSEAISMPERLLRALAKTVETGMLRFNDPG
jgi:hypothetical protein